MKNNDSNTPDQKSIKDIESEIEALHHRYKWCLDQMEGLSRQIDDAYRNDDYWDTKDLIKQRRSEAGDAKRKMDKLIKELESIKS